MGGELLTDWPYNESLHMHAGNSNGHIDFISNLAVESPELVRVTLTNFGKIVNILSLEFDQKVLTSIPKYEYPIKCDIYRYLVHLSWYYILLRSGDQLLVVMYMSFKKMEC